MGGMTLGVWAEEYGPIPESGTYYVSADGRGFHYREARYAMVRFNEAKKAVLYRIEADHCGPTYHEVERKGCDG